VFLVSELILLTRLFILYSFIHSFHSFIGIRQLGPSEDKQEHKKTCTRNRQTETNSQKPCNTENTTSLKRENIILVYPCFYFLILLYCGFASVLFYFSRFRIKLLHKLTLYSVHLNQATTTALLGTSPGKRRPRKPQYRVRAIGTALNHVSLSQQEAELTEDGEGI